MSVLNREEILAAVAADRIGITPYIPQNVRSNSYDLRIGQEFYIYDVPSRILPRVQVIDPDDVKTIDCGRRVTIPAAGAIRIDPGQFILGTTRETLRLPADLCAEVTGRSSLGRLGIQVHQTAGWIEAGFQGQITLEITNVNPHPVLIPTGLRFCQLIFHRSAPTEYLYGDMAGSKYFGQQGPTLSRIGRERW